MVWIDPSAKSKYRPSEQRSGGGTRRRRGKRWPVMKNATRIARLRRNAPAARSEPDHSSGVESPAGSGEGRSVARGMRFEVAAAYVMGVALPALEVCRRGRDF